VQLARVSRGGFAQKHYMKRITTLFCFFFVFNANAQQVFKVKHPYQADIKVYTVAYPNQADVLIYLAPYPHRVKSSEASWYLTSRRYTADKTIFFTKYRYQADVLVYFVRYPSQSKWRNTEKRKYFE